jgi:hypothetical protein
MLRGRLHAAALPIIDAKDVELELQQRASMATKIAAALCLLHEGYRVRNET